MYCTCLSLSKSKYHGLLPTKTGIGPDREEKEVLGVEAGSQGYLVALRSRICNKSALAIACPPHVEELMQKADLGFRDTLVSRWDR